MKISLMFLSLFVILKGFIIQRLVSNKSVDSFILLSQFFFTFKVKVLRFRQHYIISKICYLLKLQIVRVPGKFWFSLQYVLRKMSNIK